ncbi:MAG TPA: ATP-binding cassette domain-containing protein, partial [Alphaproteobacteria bacterium]|nr:ATP-binding cassette domain-containing protein [Alphaproteobacteria bacterium]
ALRQLDQLMRLPLERDPAAASASRKRFSGRIVFNRVSMRYRSDGEPALLGVSVEVAPREVVAITGTNGSGKSTVLKLIAGLYVPQAGTLSIDGLDLRQLNPIVLRQSVAYVPQVCQLFHGTIAQNLRLSDPTASDEDLRRAAADAHVRHEIERLPNGFDTRIGDQQLEQLPSSFRQRLCLARAYVRRTPIFLFDEATNNLDAEGDAAFMRMLAQLRESSTIVMVTHRPSHMHLADRVLMLDGGLVVAQGAPEAVLKRL